MAGNSSKHTIVALVEDRPGVLNRIVSKWRQRSFNIESLAVGHSELPGLSRMTFVVDAATADVNQVVKQVDKLIDVVKIVDVTDRDLIYRELALIKVRTAPQTRGEIVQIVDIFRANIVDVDPQSVIVEVTGTEDKIEAMIELLSSFGIIELIRTGRVAMVRGPEVSAPLEPEEGDAAPSVGEGLQRPE